MGWARSAQVDTDTRRGLLLAGGEMIEAFGVFILMVFAFVLILAVMSGVNRPAREDTDELIDWQQAAIGAADAEGIERLNIRKIINDEEQ